MNVHFRIQSKTSDEWAKISPYTPLKGEICIYEDKRKAKIGDGATDINDLKFSWLTEEEIAALLEAHTNNTENPHNVTADQIGLTKKHVTDALGFTPASVEAANNIMESATDTVDGNVGLVPAPLAGDQGKFLKGDATWKQLEISDVSGLQQALDSVTVEESGTVKQNSTEDEIELPVLLSESDNHTSGESGETNYSTGVSVNPSEKSLNATILKAKEKTEIGGATLLYDAENSRLQITVK